MNPLSFKGWTVNVVVLYPPHDPHTVVSTGRRAFIWRWSQLLKRPLVWNVGSSNMTVILEDPTFHNNGWIRSWDYRQMKALCPVDTTVCGTWGGYRTTEVTVTAQKRHIQGNFPAKPTFNEISLLKCFNVRLNGKMTPSHRNIQGSPFCK